MKAEFSLPTPAVGLAVAILALTASVAPAQYSIDWSTIDGGGGNTVAVSWQSPSTGWTLQQNTNSISSVNWSNVTGTIQDDGTTKTLLVNPPTENRFYRLHKP